MSRDVAASPLTAWIGIGALLGGATLAIALTDGVTLLRHLYLVPTVWSAWRFGLTAGVSTAVLAVVLDAPFVLPRIEAYGFDREAMEALVTFGLLLVVGALAGLLLDRGRRRSARYRTALALQHAFSSGRPLTDALAIANHVLGEYLDGRVE